MFDVVELFCHFCLRFPFFFLFCVFLSLEKRRISMLSVVVSKTECIIVVCYQLL